MPFGPAMVLRLGQRENEGIAQVTRIDGGGLAALVFCYTQIRKCGGALKLARLNIGHLSPHVRTKLDTVVEVFVDEQDAVNSFFPGRAVRHYDVLEWVRGQEKRGGPDFGIPNHGNKVC